MGTHKTTAGRALVAGLATVCAGAVCSVEAFAGGSFPGSSCDLLHDPFSSAKATAKLWYMPTYTSPKDGTYNGRTQFRVTQSSKIPPAFPPEPNGQIQLPVRTFNPTGFSFWGTELISQKFFTLNSGVDIKFRAKLDFDTPGGVVGGIFLYALKPDSKTLHDEIDFEFLTNHPRKFQTNIYGNEPLGTGHPVIQAYASGSIADFHEYEIRWLPGSVTWYVDGKQVRVVTSGIPTGPVQAYMNVWVPDASWAEAYDANIQPSTDIASNVVLNWLVGDAFCISSL